ncbi:MAG: alpha/beta hydrolase [Proteobacteria bacterium]|nr:alpha/beta hydrolase [Pseudomonadota bacterium]
MKLIAAIFGGYLVVLGAVFVLQRSLIYPAGKDVPDAALAAAAGMRIVTMRTADGLELTHWYRPPENDHAPVLVVFHGNAGTIADRVPKLAELMKAGFGLLLAGYRGYGGNPGQPSEEAFSADARLVLDWLAGQGVSPERTVLYGESLGTGIAVKMATERPAAAVILEAPYTSVAEVAQARFWFLPARWLVLDKWDSLSRIARIDAPLLLMHGLRDRTIPAYFGRRLFDAAVAPKEVLLIEDGAHNDLYDFPKVPRQVIAFVLAHATPSN